MHAEEKVPPIVALPTQDQKWQPVFVRLYAQGQRGIHLVPELRQHPTKLRQILPEVGFRKLQIIMAAFLAEVFSLISTDKDTPS